MQILPQPTALFHSCQPCLLSHQNGAILLNVKFEIHPLLRCVLPDHVAPQSDNRFCLSPWGAAFSIAFGQKCRRPSVGFVTIVAKHPPDSVAFHRRHLITNPEGFPNCRSRLVTWWPFCFSPLATARTFDSSSECVLFLHLGFPNVLYLVSDDQKSD